MQETFLKNITLSLRSAGWLMIGTGLIIWVYDRILALAESFNQYAMFSSIVGGCFVLIDILISYFLSKKK